MAKVTWRFHARYRLTWVWSSPTVDLESWKSSSIFHLIPAITTKSVSEHTQRAGA